VALDYLGGMSNVLPLTRKQAEREELERACAAYLEGGGSINRTGGQRVELRCSCCGYVGRLAVSLAASSKRHCTRCGSGSIVIAW
jgi:hypothetical protein